MISIKSIDAEAEKLLRHLFAGDKNV